MPAGSTYTPIATTTTSGSATSYTFSSVPSTYTDLVLIGSGAFSTDADFYVQFNGDTATNYSKVLIYAVSAGFASLPYTNVAQIGFGFQGGGQGNSILHIMDYKNTTTFKTTLSNSSNSGSGLQVNAGCWRSTSAINSIKVYPAAGNFANGFTLTLYGIAAA
jgi:hypothetical protein